MTTPHPEERPNDRSEERIVLHIAGPDRPGITSTLTDIVAREGAELIDIGQSVLHGYLVLSAIVSIPKGSDALRSILFTVAHLGLRLEVSAWKEPERAKRSSQIPPSFCLTLLGKLHDSNAVSETTKFLAVHHMNIRDIKTLTQGGLSGMELTVDLDSQAGLWSEKSLQTLRGEILDLAQKLSIDIAVQKDDIFRRHKRLVCMDVDSTFIQMEVIDELARLAGCYEKVGLITERAMRGELDFKAALRERVALLKGLPMSKARELLERIPLMPGAETLVSTLKGLGFHVGLVSGGFDFFVDELKRRFSLDFAFANQLEVSNGVITGQVIGSVVDPERKAQVLLDMAQVYHCKIEQTVAIGDGANDMLMLQRAGLGIAFHAKPKLQRVADLSVNQGFLDSLLLLMGFSARDLASIRS